MENVNMQDDCQFLIDLKNEQGHNVNKGVYNLICSIRDVKLFDKGIKPHRRWRLKDVKWYFGLTGNTRTILNQLISLNEMLVGIGGSLYNGQSSNN